MKEKNVSKLTVCVIELQNVIWQTALYSINDDIYWVLSRDSCIDVLKLIFPNHKKVTAETFSIDHARKSTKKNMRGDAAKEGPQSCAKTPFAQRNQEYHYR